MPLNIKKCSSKLKHLENSHTSAKVRLQTTAELAKKDFSRFARQTQM